ncbi:MAG TPA: acyl-CoA dehydratase activase [Spirochaetota bacterium]|nr:acyl-CoA dehydratase activase [Spirochaetota bacterium]HPC39610.1 acyl-CoA dehydratase activase [Spirochaetota bacterium]HPL16028.1 acyl-CoA dehydratase activase [Spirochaetota bacterium]HQF09506.1 acyl-CoA dehydratase activase [Spirochaetota bacterium]HQH98189.1 acyl-CoA dehydratase activase [Spirochaetota bacterium]
MIVAGCDVGSLTAKAVIMDENGLVASAVALAKRSPEESARAVIDRALKDAGLAMTDVAWCVGTGYGRKNISFVNSVESEIACHARGAVWQAPSARTVIDIGGQDCKAIKIDAAGGVARFLYNDKCASGTGRFLEIIADALEIGLEDLGGISMKSTKKITLSNQCVVFAETEIISLVNDGAEIPDIIRALHNAVANRAAALAKSITVEKDAVMTGGVARNAGMFEALKNALGCELLRVENPQINGAIGAALMALDAARGAGGGPVPRKERALVD